MVRTFVATYRRWLQGAMALLIAILFGLLLAFREQQELSFEKWQFALLLLHFSAIGVIHVLLMYDAWFTRGKEGFLNKIKKIAFFPIAIVYMLALALLFIEFVL